MRGTQDWRHGELLLQGRDRFQLTLASCGRLEFIHMSQQWRRLPTVSSWEHLYVAIFRCSPKATEPEEIIVADGLEIRANADLLRVLTALHTSFLSRREYHTARNPVIRNLSFRPPSDGQTNVSQSILEALRTSGSKEEVRPQAQTLVARYLGTKKVQSGALIFLVSRVKVEEMSSEACIFVFKCDFESISQLAPGRIFLPIPDAFEEEVKKAAQYPLLIGRGFDETMIRVFDELGETQYWLDFLDLEPRPPRAAALQGATLGELAKSRPEVAEKYEAVPLANRSLADSERLIEAGDRLTVTDTKSLIASLPDQLGGRKVKLILDGAGIEIPLKEYGRTWMLAEENGARYLIIKGFKLEVRSDALTPLDFAELGNLQLALAELDAPQN
jgi:hypothetical protein